MKRRMSFAAAMVFALGVVSLGASTDKDAVLKEEKALWQTVKEKNYDGFRKFLTDEYRGVYGEGILNREQEVADVKKWIWDPIRSVKWVLFFSARTACSSLTRFERRKSKTEKIFPARTTVRRFGKESELIGELLITPKQSRNNKG